MPDAKPSISTAYRVDAVKHMQRRSEVRFVPVTDTASNSEVILTTSRDIASSYDPGALVTLTVSITVDGMTAHPAAAE